MCPPHGQYPGLGCSADPEVSLHSFHAHDRCHTADSNTTGSPVLFAQKRVPNELLLRPRTYKPPPKPENGLVFLTHTKNAPDDHSRENTHVRRNTLPASATRTPPAFTSMTRPSRTPPPQQPSPQCTRARPKTRPASRGVHPMHPSQAAPRRFPRARQGPSRWCTWRWRWCGCRRWGPTSW